MNREEDNAFSLNDQFGHTLVNTETPPPMKFKKKCGAFPGFPLFIFIVYLFNANEYRRRSY